MARTPVHQPDIAGELARRVVDAVAQLTGQQIDEEAAAIREAAPEHGAEYQSNAALALAKQLGRPPRELAQEIAENLRVEDMSEPPVIAGPGFINLRLREQWLEARLAFLLDDERLGVPTVSARERFVVDYSAPNVAKEMHVGHLRSTIIGDALVRMLRFVGEEVIAQNHIGDWGTPFGMLIEQLVDEGWAPTGGAAGTDGGAGHSIADLNAFYRAANERWREDPAFAERARARVVALQGGDPPTRTLWRQLVAESERHFREVYELLGVELSDADIAGESTYQDELAEVVEELEERGLATLSEGALCVFPKGFTGRDGEPVPLIVRKSDGGYSYDTTDLAAIRRRTRELGARELLYVVGAPQRLHFEMVFQVAREMGWINGSARAEHVAFGSVLGEDRKMLRSRTGAPVLLVELLREAIDRAAQVLAQRGMEPDAELARAIGIGAVKYADLSSDREKDYVFSWARMLSFEGNTSVYLQYANARARSVLRRALSEGATPGARIVLERDAERELALALLRLPAAIDATLSDYRPHKLCGYLHGLAVSFSGFYEACPVLTAEPALRDSRLALCELTSRAITLGLS
ncbi:MAG TPA: arginine--tRNA ligase, partial [Solirubrobacteraceae bacterium]|nr:arginine--tRNA ligase [Solirubrobacteraceae bacterium]